MRVGTASAMRRRTYCLTRAPLFFDPCEGQAPAEVVPVVMLEALDVRRMRDVARINRDVHVVRLVGEVALDLVNDRATLLWIHLAAMDQHHPVQLGVVHQTSVAHRARP